MAGRTIRSSSHREQHLSQSEEQSQTSAVRDISAERVGRIVASKAKEHASEPGEFVDARSMASGKSVGSQIDESTFGNNGFLARSKVIHFPQRERERLQTKHRVLAIRIVSAVFAVAAVCALVWGLLFSPLLVLDSTQIHIGGTNTWVSDARVKALVTDQAGKSLLLIHSGKLEEQIRALPGVTQAEVTKNYPHGLTVHVQAQVPAAILKADGTMVAVDNKGRILNDVHTAVDGIPVIEVSHIESALKQTSVNQAVQILGSLDENTRKRISTVEAKTRDSITTKLDDNALTIIWGDASKLKLKMAIVTTLLSQPDTLAGATTIDVSAPDRPIIK